MGLNGLESCGNRVDDVTCGCQVSGRRDVNINQWNVKTHWVCRSRDIERDIRWDVSLQESCLKKLFKTSLSNRWFLSMAYVPYVSRSG